VERASGRLQLAHTVIDKNERQNKNAFLFCVFGFSVITAEQKQKRGL